MGLLLRRIKELRCRPESSCPDRTVQPEYSFQFAANSHLITDISMISFRIQLSNERRSHIEDEGGLLIHVDIMVQQDFYL